MLKERTYLKNNVLNDVLLYNVHGYMKRICENLRFIICKVLEWCKCNSINLVMDESFLDFADEEDISLLSEQNLCEYSNLFIVKSISKSYGIPGLRLGILASGNTTVIESVKNDVSIWNINSMAEFFMQILDKYKADYRLSLNMLKSERKRFYNELNKLSNLKVYPSQANYFICELLNGCDSKSVAAKLLNKNILIKDLSGKIGNGRQYIRIAIRTENEDNILLEKLQTII